jgi:predicted ribosome quality control (RQC) complex YloA/Tae2 family protein
MSLNWKEINLILEELDLPGSQVQAVIQSAYDVLALQTYGKHGARTILIALTPGACRIHQTFRATPKPERPLRFAEFLKSRIVNGWIEEADQLGTDRIVRLIIRQGQRGYRLYVRLWSNAANVVLCDEEGTVLDAMRRLPKRGEVTGGVYKPEENTAGKTIREFNIRELAGEGSFNEKIDRFYAEHSGALSLDALREQARRNFEGKISRIEGSLEKLRAKETEYANADLLKQYGDIIMANLEAAQSEWLEAANFFTDPPSPIRIKLDPQKSLVENAQTYYARYRKAKSGLEEVRAEIRAGQEELSRLSATLERLLSETNPLALHKALQNNGRPPLKGAAAKALNRKRPGLSFWRKDWLIIVGRDARENDDLLRHYVKGGDLWLHARDWPGSYVFIKQRSGKTVPLDILLDAGNLALFYSKGRSNAAGDLFYTPVKYLRRAKNGPKGLVIPTHEKNLRVKVEQRRLKELEECKIL